MGIKNGAIREAAKPINNIESELTIHDVSDPVKDKENEHTLNVVSDKDWKVGLEKIHKETNGDLRLHIFKQEKEIYQLKKDIAFQKENHQMDIIQKDNEIGRLMKKITEK